MASRGALRSKKCGELQWAQQLRGEIVRNSPLSQLRRTRSPTERAGDGGRQRRRAELPPSLTSRRPPRRAARIWRVKWVDGGVETPEAGNERTQGYIPLVMLVLALPSPCPLAGARCCSCCCWLKISPASSLQQPDQSSQTHKQAVHCPWREIAKTTHHRLCTFQPKVNAAVEFQPLKSCALFKELCPKWFQLNLSCRIKNSIRVL